MTVQSKTIPDLLTPSVAAEKIGVKTRTLALWRAQGKGPRYVRLGEGARARVRYPTDALAAWIEEIQEANTGVLYAPYSGTSPRSSRPLS